MRKLFLFLTLLICARAASAQLFKKPILTGMYLQWGYNRDRFSQSDLHFSRPGQYDFTLYHATAHDQPDFEGFRTNPIDITIPQNVYRIGFYLNKQHTHAIEINFDHAKYVVGDNQNLHIKGEINGRQIDKDTIVERYFVHFEHTNGANFYHINYVGMHELLRNKKNTRTMATVVWKAGAGVVVPRSDVIIMGKQLDNQFHVAGYIISAEAGLRFYPLRNLFMEATAKGGFANYLSVLTTGDEGRAHHHFYYGEVIGTVGYDINFGHKHRKEAKE